MSSAPCPPDGDVRDDEPPAYEPPAIEWEEPYEPVGFGISCALEGGNPGCIPGPAFT